uniref:Uncharacterized protein n=1 Tax=Panagrolaimus sp. JU765 TaxID=591449 RepID=A0AC34RMH8_9BILA
MSTANIVYSFFVDYFIPNAGESNLRRIFKYSQGRRRSLSPLTLSIVANYVNHEPTTLANTAAIGAKSRLIANEHFIRRRSVTPTRRRYHSIPNTADDGTINGKESKPLQKPPTILVYTANDNHLFKRIFDSLYKILPKDVYTIFHLSNKSLISDPWVDENAVCVLLADTKSLGDLGWSRLQSYFIHLIQKVLVILDGQDYNLTSFIQEKSYFCVKIVYLQI